MILEKSRGLTGPIIYIDECAFLFPLMLIKIKKFKNKNKRSWSFKYIKVKQSNIMNPIYKRIKNGIK